MRLKMALAGLGFFLLPTAQAKPAKVLHTFNKAIIRMTVGDRGVLSQDVSRALHYFDFDKKEPGSIAVPRAPFVTDSSGTYSIFGMGRPWDGNVDVMLFDFASKSMRLIDSGIPWIVEPGLDVRTLPDGRQRIRAVWEHAQDFIQEKGISVMLYEQVGSEPSTLRTLAYGPIETLSDTAPSAVNVVQNSYPKIDGDLVVFVSTEYGLPQIYLHNLKTGVSAPVARSEYFQERPSIHDGYIAWQESEMGFRVSDQSWIVVYDLKTQRTRRVSPEGAFDLWPKISGHYLTYTAKRQPNPHLLSVRVYDLEKNVEYQAQRCFPGKISDFGLTREGVVAGQSLDKITRLLFASWDQIAAECN